MVGVSDAATYAKGNFDGSGNSFNGEALAAAGYTPGAKVTVQGAEFTWPTGAPGTPNLVKDQSAPILVSGTGSHLALLGAGASLNAKGSVTVIYTDGTESQAPCNSRTGAARTRPPAARTRGRRSRAATHHPVWRTPRPTTGSSTAQYR